MTDKRDTNLDRDLSDNPGIGQSKGAYAMGGDHVRKAQEWGGGSKGAKGPVTAADRNNEQSSAKS